MIVKVKEIAVPSSSQKGVEIIVEDMCPICLGCLTDLCPECETKRPSATSEECTIAVGSCNHAFHFHCLSYWLRIRQVCPMDNRKCVISACDIEAD